MGWIYLVITYFVGRCVNVGLSAISHTQISTTQAIKGTYHDSSHAGTHKPRFFSAYCCATKFPHRTPSLWVGVPWFSIMNIRPLNILDGITPHTPPKKVSILNSIESQPLLPSFSCLKPHMFLKKTGGSLIWGLPLPSQISPKGQMLGSHCCCWPALIAWWLPGNERFPSPPNSARPWRWAQWCWQSKSNFLGNPTFYHGQKSIPSGEHTKSYWKWPSRNSGFSHERWWFSMAKC